MNNIKYFLFIVSVLCLGFYPLKAQNTVGSNPPKLVVLITVEQMRYDFIQRYWDSFRDDGFKQLVSQGASCTQTELNYLYSQSTPGYASLVTGTTPSVHGIVADKWYFSTGNKKVFSTLTGSYGSVGTNGSQGQHIPSNMIVSTIGDQLKLKHSNSKVISVGLSPESAVLTGGHSADAAYWIDDKTGNWITCSYYMQNLPSWVQGFNNKNLQTSYLDRNWQLSNNSFEYTASRADKSEYEKGFGIDINTFPYDIAQLSRIKGDYPDFSYLNKTPFGNSYTKDFAVFSILNEALGKDEQTDLLLLNFTANQFISNQFGPYSVENQDAYIRLDKEIAHFLNFLDAEIGKDNVLLILTSNHGVADAPQFLEKQRLPHGEFKSYYAVALLKSYLNATYGNGNWVSMYFNQQIYLNRVLIEDSKLELEAVQQKVVDFMIQLDGVANAFSASVLSKSEFSSGIYKKMQNSYNQSRSGDVMVNLQPGWTEDINSTTISNSPYVYDSHIPLIWYGWQIKPQSYHQSVSITDIAPSIAAFLNISKPNACSGKPIWGLLK